MQDYGKELIIDLHSCDVSTFTRDSIRKYFETLCDDVIYMEREDLHFWDYEGDPKAYESAPDHLKGISAVQFIKTSNIVIHTIDVMKNVHINIFSCKDFDSDKAEEYTKEWFGGESLNVITVPRMKDFKVEIIQMKGNNFLWINDYLWMWDIKAEKEAQRRLAKPAYGDVLVAGYGLGLVQKFLLENENVSSVTTIELTKKVIDENIRVFGKVHGEVIIGDFFDYNPSDNKFDCVIGDICDDIFPEYLPDYKKIKAHSANLLKPNGKLLQWGGDYFEYLITMEGKKGC